MRTSSKATRPIPVRASVTLIVPDAGTRRYSVNCFHVGKGGGGGGGAAAAWNPTGDGGGGAGRAGGAVGVAKRMASGSPPALS